MSLFHKWRGELQLPPLPERRMRIGSNLVVQSVFPGTSCKAEIADSQVKGHDLLTTNLAPPYQQLLLRHKGARRVSRIVVCVDMLGEGFDLPNLKVAALHDTHKSLAVTLQFIGRFTRKGASGVIGEATVVTNIADPDAESKLADLYAEGADWDKIIRRLSEERVDKELRLQDVVFGLKGEGDLHAQLSLWNLRPALSAQFFRTKCAAWSPLEFHTVLPKDAEYWHSYSEKDNVLVAVVCRSGAVSWGNYQNVLDTIYDLVIMRWDKAAGALCLFASDYNSLRSEKMAEAVTDANTTLVAGKPIFNILNNVELPLVKSLGSSRVGAISFTSYFGPKAHGRIGL